jgi:hypothetical protein
MNVIKNENNPHGKTQEPTSKVGEPKMRVPQATLDGMTNLFGDINANVNDVNHEIALQYAIKNRTGYPSEESRQIQTDKWKQMLLIARNRYPNIQFSEFGMIKPSPHNNFYGAVER